MGTVEKTGTGEAVERFLSYLEREKLWAPGERVLLGISGGLDSMCMAFLFSKSPCRFGIAHCNFRLRGEESDGDAIFVEEQAGKYGAPFFSSSFDTAGYAASHGVSIQMAARELRYRWFEEIRLREGYASVAVGHHLNDLVETMLINLVRGTGIAGLHGIMPRNSALIRPMLCFTREEIGHLVSENRIPYREDSSNQSDKYMRNRLRHQVIPILKDLNPALESTFAATASYFAETERLVAASVEEGRHLMKEEDGVRIISYPSLVKFPSPAILLQKLLGPLGFSPAVTGAMLQAEGSQSGKRFYSESHLAVKDRDRLIIVPREEPIPLGQPGPREEAIPREETVPREEAGPPSFGEVFEMTVREVSGAAIREAIGVPGLHTTDGNDPDTALLDYDTLALPLEVRYWQEGDRFRPLGMKGMKKLSDFFIDLKVPLHLKHRIPLLISRGKIVWVAGYRIADPFKITSATKRVCEIRLKLSKNTLNLG